MQPTSTPARPTSRLSSLFAAALFATTAAAAPAGAAVLVADNFNDLAPGANISGRTPQTTVNGANWIASPTNFIANAAGGLDVANGTTRSAHVDLGAGYLAANPGVYEAQLDIFQPTLATPSGSWIGFGFSRGASDVTGPDTGKNLVDNLGAPWLLWRVNGQEIVWAGPGNTNSALSLTDATTAPGATRNFRLVLDTTPAQWTLNAYLDGVQQDLNGATAGNTYTYAVGKNPIDSRYLSLSTGVSGTATHGTGTIDNLQLTGPVAVPEPGTISLAVAGLALLATRRRRRA